MERGVLEIQHPRPQKLERPVCAGSRDATGQEEGVQAGDRAARTRPQAMFRSFTCRELWGFTGGFSNCIWGCSSEMCAALPEKPTPALQGPQEPGPAAGNSCHVFTGDHTVEFFFYKAANVTQKQTLFHELFKASIFWGCLLLPCPFLSPVDCHL